MHVVSGPAGRHPPASPALAELTIAKIELSTTH
jgi:hypothetical protein